MARVSAQEAWDLAVKLEAALGRERVRSSNLAEQLRAEHEMLNRRIGPCGSTCEACALLDDKSSNSVR